MAVIDEVLNAGNGDIGYFSVGLRYGPRFDVDIVSTPGGYEKRNYNGHEAGRRGFFVDFGVREQSVIDTLKERFVAVQGKNVGFLIYHPQENTLTDQQIGVGDGSTDEFQTVKTYTWGALTRTQNIYKLVSATQTVYFDDVEQMSGWSVDISTGLFSFTSPPGIGVVITVDTQYYIPVRFDTVTMDKIIAGGEIHEWRNIPLVELVTAEEVLT